MQYQQFNPDDISRKESEAFDFPVFQPSFLITLPLILASDVRDIEDHSRLRVFVYYGDEDSNIFPNANIVSSIKLYQQLRMWVEKKYEPSTRRSIFCTSTSTWTKRYFVLHE